MNLWIKNGHLLDPANKRNEICDLYIKDGKVAGIGSLSSNTDTKEFEKIPNEYEDWLNWYSIKGEINV